MLGLTTRDNFYGIVGTETNAVCNGETVCIGDTVSVGKGENWDESEGTVLMLVNKISVMGLAGSSIDELNIKKIVRSHKDLRVGDIIEDAWRFRVSQIKGIKEQNQPENKRTKLSDLATEELVTMCLDSKNGSINIDIGAVTYSGLARKSRKDYVNPKGVQERITFIDSIYEQLKCSIKTFEIVSLQDIVLATNVRVAVKPSQEYGNILTLYYIEVLLPSEECQLVERDWAFQSLRALPLEKDK